MLFCARQNITAVLFSVDFCKQSRSAGNNCEVKNVKLDLHSQT